MKQVFAILAASVAMSAATAKEPEIRLQYLSISSIAPYAMLPPPAQDGSQAQKDELAEIQGIAKSRSEDRLKQARYDDVTISPVIFQSVVPGFDVAKLPVTAKLLDDVKREANTVSHVAKMRFDRKRPYEFDPTLNVCSQHRGKNATYPSGHATMGFALASMLSRLIPAKSGALMVRAQDYGYSRMVCGVHYRSDVEAGQVIGTSVVLAMSQNEQIRKDMDAARAELQAAGLTK
jgi:acid phosphatase (class A)